MTIEGFATLLSIVIALFAFDLTLLLRVCKVRTADRGDPTVVLDDPHNTVGATPISGTNNGNSMTGMMRGNGW